MNSCVGFQLKFLPAFHWCLRYFWIVADYSVNWLLTQNRYVYWWYNTFKLVFFNFIFDRVYMMHLENTCHVSGVKCVNLSQTVRAGDLQLSHTIHYTLWVQCHMSRVTYQVSHVRCHMSVATCHLSCVMCHVSCVLCHVSCGLCHT